MEFPVLTVAELVAVVYQGVAGGISKDAVNVTQWAEHGLIKHFAAVDGVRVGAFRYG